MLRAMRCFTWALLLSAMIPIRADQPKEMIHVHAKVVDWRGRPAPGSTVSLTLIQHLGKEIGYGFHRDFQVTATSGQVELEAPSGTWLLDAWRAGKRRGHAVLERNACLPCGAPEFRMTASNDPAHPFVLKLQMAEWNEFKGSDCRPLDMTSTAQGLTISTNELAALPIR